MREQMRKPNDLKGSEGTDLISLVLTTDIN
jgi:hypothetical protein